MNLTSPLDLDGPDLVIVLLILLLLWGARGLSSLAGQMGDELRRWQGEPPQSRKTRRPLTSGDRWILLLALLFFLVACVLWFFHQRN